MRTVSKTLLAITAVLAVTFVTAEIAAAHTCNSGCNQVRRVCKKVSKSVRDSARVECQEVRDGCRAACEVDVDPKACKQGCNADSDACKIAAEDARTTAGDACIADRDVCKVDCVGDVDGDCIKACRTIDKGCLRDVKAAERDCRDACPSDNTKKACRLACKQLRYDGRKACYDTSVGCHTDCLPLPSPTTTVP